VRTALTEPDPDLVRGVLAAETAALADALALVEDFRPELVPRQRALLGALETRTPETHTVIGLTGAPGVGKSTLAGALIRHWTERGLGVGMTAVDPSSRASGGALLGDRARLRFEPDARVFVRSMAARDQLGGLAPATRAAVLVLRAAFPWTLVETVGVGQSEVDIDTVADSVALVLQPDSGDTLQFMKAGILEIPDLLVVHKWDLGAPAERTRADLGGILRSDVADHAGWEPPIIGASAATGCGVEEVARAFEAHRAHLDATGTLATRRARSRAEWALELFARRYGSLGIERVGGRAAAERIVREAGGAALDAFSDLATRAGLEPAPE
jgi:LAO/AO transport system kinase